MSCVRWVKLKNEDFNNFNIEAMSDGIEKLAIYMPIIYKTGFINLIEPDGDTSEEDKAKILTGLLYAAEKAGVEDDINMLKNILNELQILNSIETNVKNGKDIIKPGYPFMLNYKFSKIADSDEQLYDAINFQNEEIEKKLGGIVHFGNDEYIISYDKYNFFGKYEGTIFTNKRIIILSDERKNIPWSEVREFKEAGLFSGRKLNGEKFICNTKHEQLIKSMIDFDAITFCMIIRSEGFLADKGRLYIGREANKN